MSNNEAVSLVFALKQQNIHKLEELWHSVSTPGSSKCGKLLTRDEVAALVAPKEETKQAVLSYLKDSNWPLEIEDRNDFLIVKCTVLPIVQARFFWYSHKSLPGKKLARVSGDYCLPSTIASTFLL